MVFKYPVFDAAQRILKSKHVDSFQAKDSRTVRRGCPFKNKPKTNHLDHYLKRDMRKWATLFCKEKQQNYISSHGSDTRAVIGTEKNLAS